MLGLSFDVCDGGQSLKLFSFSAGNGCFGLDLFQSYLPYFGYPILRQEIPPVSRLNPDYLIKELGGTYVMAHQRQAPTANTELLTLFIWFPYLKLNLPPFDSALFIAFFSKIIFWPSTFQFHFQISFPRNFHTRYGKILVLLMC